jgi:aminomethyltransferase
MVDSQSSETRAPQAEAPLAETALAAAHRAAGARMVPFAGYLMPVQYPSGILAEHVWTRTSAGLFDVSHMGQARLVGPDFETAARALETLVAADILGLRPGQQRYTQILNEEGGIVDDLMVARPAAPDRPGEILLVVNAGTKDADFRLMNAHLPADVVLEQMPERGLLALQGPRAAEVVAELAPETAAMAFMQTGTAVLAGIPVALSRSGYTGEDGFEISVAAEDAVALWTRLLGDERVRPIGLGARDSLRLEAGLPLYGHDINQETSPVEAGLTWSIAKRRRQEGGFPGQIRIGQEIAGGPVRRRVGILLEGRTPAREHADILDAAGELIGQVTSGEFAAPGTALGLVVRGRTLQGRVVPMPFVPHRYKR